MNSDIEGRQYPAGDVYEVGREQIRAFAAATHADHAAYTDPDAAQALGYSDVIAPPTFAVIPAQRSDARLIADPDAGIDFSRVVHGSQRFTHHRPIVAGDRLVAELFVDSVRTVGPNAMVTTRSEIEAEDGERVVTAISSIVIRGDDS
ncbi:FAS1-like dehydratase domain-containing protein [Spelaeicoccus albus]|uniref:UPF0336 protein BJY26_003662 n=1 Tax=Spelaeicoccus albus TaxID=1280376 RepID=A0A7Z0D5M5_9MICO|nr:MaoC family dehydratase N-terminal domain-containing protein [Spelaeicoccus albus]NYI69356.1 acyl dehydratase [Spelaeicoccus albus]